MEDIFAKLDEVLAEIKRKAGKLEAENEALRRERQGEIWYWQGDGEDHLESLTCPVLIEAADLRELLKEADGFGTMPRWGQRKGENT